MNPGAALTAETVETGFRMMLRRPPENAGVVRHYLSLGLTQGAFLDVLMDSEEFRERHRRNLAIGDLARDGPAAETATGPRVLLFGAFGNGNVGDAAQAAAVAALVGAMAPPGIHPRFAATSWERRRPYAAAGMEVLRPDALLRPEHIRPRGPGDRDGADLVVIGGGGLFGTPHFPLHTTPWAEWFVGRGVPFALLGVGGSATALSIPDWRRAYELLLTGATFVGLRDQETLDAARAMRPDAAWFPDPVLADALPRRVATDAQPRPIDAVLIPRAPNQAADRAALDGLRRMDADARHAGRHVVIASLERDADAAVLGAIDARYVESWDELLALCRQARVVVSARLHGVVAGLACGCVVHGLTQPKIGDLMHRLGIGAWFSADGWPDRTPDLSPAAETEFHAALAPGLDAFGWEVAEAMATAAAVLGPVLQGAGERKRYRVRRSTSASPPSL